MSKKIMLVTINTDASFYNSVKKASYAFIAVSNNWRITKTGMLKTKIGNPTEAELKCIINALYLILNTQGGINKVIVNTDSLNSIHLLNNDVEKINQYRLSKRVKNVKRLDKIIKSSKNPNVVIEYRHVKAHTGDSSRRSIVNEMCDMMAKETLRKHVKPT